MRSLQELQELLSPQGIEAIQQATALNPHEETFLQCYQKLCKIFPPSLARNAVETVILRNKAIQSKKFLIPEKLYYTPQAYEQASGYLISGYRAKRFRDCSIIIDICCSIGSDTIALAQYGKVIGIDLDLIRLMLAKVNCSIWVCHTHNSIQQLPYFIQSDASNILPFRIRPNSGIFFDPSRRNSKGRLKSISDYHPPLSVIHQWLSHFKGIGVKISPAVDYNELIQFFNYGAEIEFISVNKDLKEAVLWFNELSTTTRRATVLPSGLTMEETQPSPCLALSKPLQYLYEPDPAIIRAQLIAKLGWEISAYQLDQDIAYLTSDKLTITPFAQSWEVEDWFPFQLKRLRAYLKSHHISSVVVKKRGSPLQPEALIKSLKLSGDEKSRTLFMTHLEGKPIVIIAQPKL